MAAHVSVHRRLQALAIHIGPGAGARAEHYLPNVGCQLVLVPGQIGLSSRRVQIVRIETVQSALGYEWMGFPRYLARQNIRAVIAGESHPGERTRQARHVLVSGSRVGRFRVWYLDGLVRQSR